MVSEEKLIGNVSIAAPIIVHKPKITDTPAIRHNPIAIPFHKKNVTVKAPLNPPSAFPTPCDRAETTHWGMLKS